MDTRKISSGKSSYDETKVPSHTCLYIKVANSFGKFLTETYWHINKFALENIENNEKLIKN